MAMLSDYGFLAGFAWPGSDMCRWNEQQAYNTVVRYSTHLGRGIPAFPIQNMVPARMTAVIKTVRPTRCAVVMGVEVLEFMGSPGVARLQNRGHVEVGGVAVFSNPGPLAMVRAVRMAEPDGNVQPRFLALTVTICPLG